MSQRILTATTHTAGSTD